MSKSIYAIYKGDEFLDLGTVEEMAKKFNVRKQTITFWASPANTKRVGKNGKVAVRIDDN